MKENNEKKLQALLMKGEAILLSGFLAVSSSGCANYKASSTNSGIKYDTINTLDSDLVTNGIEQVLDVPYEDFKLEVNYRCILENNSKWTITSDKSLFMDVNTIGLPSGYKVYIDNVHIDAIIKSCYSSVDGIIQDSMDDRIHNSQMIGFPIDNSISYNNIFDIAGQNDTFIHGSFLGFNGISSGSVHEKRYTEKDYLSRGVYANKINSVIDLIIVRPDGTTHCASVPSTILVTVWPFIKYVSDNVKKPAIYYYYYYNDDYTSFHSKEISEEDYQEIFKNNEMQKKLK